MAVPGGFQSCPVKRVTPATSVPQSSQDYTMTQCPGWLEQGGTVVSDHMSQQLVTSTESQEGQMWIQVAQRLARVGPDEAER